MVLFNFRFQPNGVGLHPLLSIKIHFLKCKNKIIIYIFCAYFCPDSDDSNASESECSEESDEFSDGQESKVPEVCQQNPHLICVTPHFPQTSDLHLLAFLF